MGQLRSRAEEREKEVEKPTELAKPRTRVWTTNLQRAG